MKPDEKLLLEKLIERGAGMQPTAIELAQLIDMPEKRAVYILGKWAKKGWYDYGVSIGTGWLYLDEIPKVD